MTTDQARGKRRMSRFALGGNCLPIQTIPGLGLGQSCPQQYPQPAGVIAPAVKPANRNPLGEPLSIREAAELIGCSAWTVRQTHVPHGLPCFRSGPNGKLIFYRDQVVQWILSQQQRKGGYR